MQRERRSTEWTTRLTELAREHDVPGASLAVLVDGRVHTAVTGVCNIETGVEVTPDTLFQIGSTTKVHTATCVMRLVDDGRVDLDAPVVDTVPELRVGGDAATRQVTPRHLLTHTSGIAGDAIFDTGCGDDALRQLVERVGDLEPDVPVGAVHSYSNVGFVVLGRLIEAVTGMTWDAALRDLVLDPLGLEQTTSNARDLVRFRATCGHVGGGDEVQLEPAMPIASTRSMSPAGATMYASATDVVRLGRLFLDRGLAPDGARLLSTEAIDEMLRPQVPVPAVPPARAHCGLAWMLHDWDGRRVVEHGGGTLGHLAFFEMVPDRGVAIALLTNGRSSFADDLYRELLRELCELERPTPAAPVASTDGVVSDEIVGRYRRCGVEIEVERGDRELRAVERMLEPLASIFGAPEPTELELRPATAGSDVYVARDGGAWDPVFFERAAAEQFLHRGGRAHRRVDA